MWYQDHGLGLGHDFRFELRSALDRISSNPLSFPAVHRQIRRALLNRFPHALYFFIGEENIFITACIHQKRNPNVWRSRR